ncbi:hypothetical protein L1887_29261 [Cichorium endivia]|nr:hypothetical protein L1887_29261 [Cichorium endivia]
MLTPIHMDDSSVLLWSSGASRIGIKSRGELIHKRIDPVAGVAVCLELGEGEKVEAIFPVTVLPEIRSSVYAEDLHPDTTNKDLYLLFSMIGHVHSIAKDGLGKSKGFGFVQYDSEVSANDALTALDGTTFEGGIISIAKFLKKSERKEPDFTNVYGKNLDSDGWICSDDLDLLLEEEDAETACYTALVANNANHPAVDMSKVLQMEIK